MSANFKRKLIAGYASDPAYRYIFSILDANVGEGAVKLPFIRDPDGLIFRINPATNDYTFISRRLYILDLYVKNIL